MAAPKHTHKEPLKYVRIDDFRAGIYSDIRAAASSGGIVDAEKPGMAAEGTIGCISNNTGQLVPLPSGTPDVYVFPFDGASRPFAAGGAAISVGLETVGPINTASQTNADDIWVFANYASHIVPSFWDVYRAVVIKGGTSPVTPRDAMQGQQILSNTAISRRGVSSCFTRGRSSNFNAPGFPIFAWEYTSGEPYHDGAIAHYDVYPDPGNLGSDNYYQEIYTVTNGSSIYGGQLVAHTGRILRLCENLTQHGLNVSFETNELVRYTDPPGNIALNTNATDSILDPQIPGGYGAWGSMSFGELLLIKRVGGALLVEGDVYAPQITRLPGIADVGNLKNMAVASPIGLIYCVENDGAYVWSGGSTSQKISTINDRFHTPPQQLVHGIRTSLDVWNNWVVFSNGWLFDTVTSSWWQLDQKQALPNDDGIQWVAAGKGTQQYLYVVPGDLTAHNDSSIHVGRYDIRSPSKTYTWKSQPLPVSYGHSIDIREVSITCSNLTGTTTTIAVQFHLLTGGFSPWETFTFGGGLNHPGPIRLTKPIGIQGESIMITVVATSDVVAPTINAIEIGYITAEPFSQASTIP